MSSPMSPRYRSAAEEIEARIETLTREAENDRVTAKFERETAEALECAADRKEKIIREYRAMQATT